jgi:uncharacterized protein (TIGR02118 family)
MFKVIFLHRFRPDRDPAEVRDWWLNHHGPICLQSKGVKRYIQNHWIESPLAGERAFDGSVDLWFESREAYEATMASPEWRALVADGPDGFDEATLEPTLIGGFVNEHIMRWDGLPEGRVYTGAEVYPRH